MATQTKRGSEQLEQSRAGIAEMLTDLVAA